ncbi:Hypothetical Protein FCC1311_102272 [Hondaea fermentalgiana]|uniref:Uncharacterized protein n=1 Tax=Hondaea fermentalgiana TaxID=2315210 RepID=A0A2R5H105_9STRA|nr:Hypothetical Protein FCC1311_102272 [Hondaea fermentalgiana]|eukprot:GBG34004.1 Hypothetical Protein FCC1311_102272 [Hondaea fermentalgiana]
MKGFSFSDVAATPPPAFANKSGSLLFDSPVGVQRSPTQADTPQGFARSPDATSGLMGTPVSAKSSSRSSVGAGSASRAGSRYELVPAEVSPEETQRFVAQCGSSAIVLEASHNATRLLEFEVTKYADEVRDTRAIRCFPGLPSLNGQSVLRVSADARQQSLLIATTRNVIVCHLGQTLAGTSPLGRLRGTLMPSDADADADTYTLKAVGRTSFGILEIEGTMRDGELTGRLRTDNGALSGSFRCEKGGHFAGNATPVMGETWTGSCLVTRHASLPIDLPFSFTVTSLERKPGNALSVMLDVGSAGVEVIDANTFQTSKTPIVDAQWHPLIRNNVVVLDSRGMVRVYDLSGDLDEPVWSGSVLVGSLRKRTCVAMCFGAAPGHTSTSQVASRSVLQLERRLGLFVLVDTGAVVSLCPIGCFPADSPDVKALHTALLEEIKHDPSIENTSVWSGAMQWTESILSQSSTPMSPMPILHCPAPTQTVGPSSHHHRGGHGGSDGSARSSGPSPTGHACGIAYVPVEGTGSAAILRAWTSGRVDTLLGGMPVRLRVQETLQNDVAANGIEGFLRTPHRASRPAGLTPGRGSLDTPSRASPLQNLSSKLRSAYLRGREAGDDNESAPELKPQTLRFDDEEDDDFDENAEGRDRIGALTQFGSDEGDSQLVESDVARARGPRRSSAMHVQSNIEDLKMNARPPILVACTQMNIATALVLERDVVHADMVIGKDRVEGGVHVLWLPWLLDLAKPHRFDVEAVSRLLTRVIPDVRGLSGPASAAVFVEPGVGHLALSMQGGNEAAIVRCDVGTEIMKMSASLGAETARGGLNGENSAHGGLLRDGRDDESEGDDGDQEDTARQLDELKVHFNQQLTRLTAIPRKLRSVKLMSPDTPPALSLAICSWLHELSETLLYGHAKSNVTGLMEGIRRGMDTLQRMRADQVLQFNAQVQALADVRKSLESSFSSAEALKTGQVARLGELQSLLEESFECLEEQVASLGPRSTPADRQLLRAFTELEERTVGLDEDMSTCASRIDRVQENEKRLLSKPYAEDCLKGQEALKSLRELQSRTQDLIGRMAQVQEKPQTDRMSVLSLQERIWAARERIQSIAASGVFVGAPVTLVAFASEGITMMEQELQEGAITSVKVDRELLQRGHQTGLRRLMGLDAMICPFALPTPTRSGGAAGTIHLILLSESVRVEFENGCCTIEAIKDPSSAAAAAAAAAAAGADLVEVTLVDLTHEEDAPRAEAMGLHVCADNADVEQTCQKLSGLARMPTAETVRIVASSASN